MAKIYDLRTGQRKKVSCLEFIGLLEAVEKYIEQLRPRRSNQSDLDNALEIITLMKFNAHFNQKFRDANVQPLEELLDEIHIELEDEKWQK